MASQTGGHGAVNQLPRKAAIVLNVNLEPHGTERAGTDFFNGETGKRGGDEGGIGAIGAVDGGEFAFGMEDFVIADRGEQDGRNVLASQESDARIDVADIDEQAGEEAKTFEGGAILAEGDFAGDPGFQIFRSHEAEALVGGLFVITEGE